MIQSALFKPFKQLARRNPTPQVAPIWEICMQRVLAWNRILAKRVLTTKKVARQRMFGGVIGWPICMA